MARPPLLGEVHIADLTVIERFDDGSSITTTGRGRMERIAPGLFDDDPPRHQIRWFADDDGRYYTINYEKGRP